MGSDDYASICFFHALIADCSVTLRGISCKYFSQSNPPLIRQVFAVNTPFKLAKSTI